MELRTAEVVHGVRVSAGLGTTQLTILEGKRVGTMGDPAENASVLDGSNNAAGSWMGGTTGMLLSIVASAGLGMLGGLLIGRKVGETRGLAVGIELGRLEAAATAPPRGWRRFWRRGTETPAA